MANSDHGMPTITKVSMWGYECPTCGDRSNLAARCDGSGNAYMYHNGCGHWADTGVPWAQFVEQHINSGWVRYGDGTTLVELSELAKTMVNRVGPIPGLYQAKNAGKSSHFAARLVGLVVFVMVIAFLFKSFEDYQEQSRQRARYQAEEVAARERRELAVQQEQQRLTLENKRSQETADRSAPVALTVINESCLPADLYGDQRLVASLPAKTSAVFLIPARPIRFKACEDGNPANCGVESLNDLTGKTSWTHRLTASPDCAREQAEREENVRLGFQQQREQAERTNLSQQPSEIMNVQLGVIQGVYFRHVVPGTQQIVSTLQSIEVRFDNGNSIVIEQQSEEQFRRGERVRVFLGNGTGRVTH